MFWEGLGLRNGWVNIPFHLGVGDTQGTMGSFERTDVNQGLKGSGYRFSTEISLYVETKLTRAAGQNRQGVLWPIYSMS